MLNLDGMTRAPEWRVELARKRSLNEAQNARQRVAYVIAPDEASAKQMAARKNPEFIAVSAKKTT
jgi:hypothetical protein